MTFFVGELLMISKCHALKSLGIFLLFKMKQKLSILNNPLRGGGGLCKLTLILLEKQVDVEGCYVLLIAQ